MTNVTKKLVLSLVAVILTVIALGTTTFAWFTITNVASVQPFQAQVISDEGIEIAIGTGDPLALEWKTTLTTQDIYNYLDSVYGANGFRFNHVTSPDGRNFYGLGTGTTGNGTTEGYLSLPLHFRSDSTSEITWTQVILSGTQASFITRVGFTDSKGVDRAANSSLFVNPADAIRVSITGMVGGSTTTVAYENPVSSTNTVLGGLINADLRGDQEDVLGVPTYIGVDGAQNYFYRSNAILPGGIEAVNVVSTVDMITSTKILDMSSNQILIADAEYYGTVTVHIWFEGWDAEGYNALLGRIISLSLRFEG
jgi:hypothetical protein